MTRTTLPITHAFQRRIHLRRSRVTCLEGPDAPGTWTFEQDVVRIGSGEENDLCLADDAVSRRHVVIARTREGVVLRDLGSTNGTWVGEVRVREIVLEGPCRFRVGRSLLQFEPVDDALEVLPSEEEGLLELAGRSVAMREQFTILRKVAPTRVSVLITGETGTGKELAARTIHALSPRRGGPYVVFDCGTVPESLLSSALFGHEKGAFTGAHEAREGVFQAADGGTLLLDEIGELPLEHQAHLLRAVDQRTVQPLGGQPRRVDVRVVAATNRDLAEAVEAGRFRADLYYRLAVVEVHMPPLRDRLEDIDLLVPHLLARVQGDPPRVRGVSDAVMEVFRSWRWPGNVRELANVLERALPFTEGDTIELDALPDALRVPEPPAPGPPLSDRPFKEARDALVEAFERRYLEDLLARHGGVVSRAARAAGVNRSSILRLMRKHGIVARPGRRR